MLHKPPRLCLKRTEHEQKTRKTLDVDGHHPDAGGGRDGETGYLPSKRCCIVPSTNFGHQVALLELVVNAATRWRHLYHLYIWPTVGASWIIYKFGHQVVPLALVSILVTRWRYLNWLSMWPPDGTTCISCIFGQQLALLELVTSLVTKWCHLH